MNRQEVKGLRGVLGVRNSDAEVAVIPQQEGVKVVISGSEMGSGASGPHMGTDVKFCMRDDGPLIRFLLNGHL